MLEFKKARLNYKYRLTDNCDLIDLGIRQEKMAREIYDRGNNQEEWMKNFEKKTDQKMKLLLQDNLMMRRRIMSLDDKLEMILLKIDQQDSRRKVTKIITNV